MKILSALLLFSSCVFAQNSLDKVSWLSGCWGGDVEGAKYIECWTSAAGNLMQGSAKMYSGDKIFMREAMTIELEKEAIVMYVLPYEARFKAKQESVGFTLKSSSKTELVFENPAHDYPQRIIYTKDAKGNILARIEKMDGTKKMTFPMNDLEPKKGVKR